jgi:uncharacterized coiled-coil DUF342 family protein
LDRLTALATACQTEQTLLNDQLTALERERAALDVHIAAELATIEREKQNIQHKKEFNRLAEEIHKLPTRQTLAEKLVVVQNELQELQDQLDAVRTHRTAFKNDVKAAVQDIWALAARLEVDA